MPALGERFRAAREARGLSLSDVAEQIRIRSVYLAAIEDDNWSAIGAPVYVRGFLRTYARFVGLDSEEVVTEFNAQSHTPPVPDHTDIERNTTPDRRDRHERRTTGGASSLLVWAAAVVAVLLIAFVVYQALTLPGRSTAPVAEVTATPLASATPEPTTTPLLATNGQKLPDGPKSMALVLTAPSWMRVTIDGDVSIEGTFPAGTTKTFHGKSALVRLGNAGGVEIYVDGKDVGKLGKPGDVVERAFTL